MRKAYPQGSTDTAKALKTAFEKVGQQAVVSANNLTAEAKQIQQQAIEFQTCLSGLKELKDNVDDVLVTFGKV